jgi:O-antigen ligase
MLLNRQKIGSWFLIICGLGLSLVSGYFVAQSNDRIFLCLYGAVAVILLIQILRKPFMGLVFMLASLPMLMYTKLPGNLDFTSITSLFGLGALISFVLHKRRSLNSPGVYDKPILISAILLLLSVVVGEIFKPVNTETFFPLTYLQLLILIWLAAKVFTSRQEIETLMKLFIGANILALLIVLPNFDQYVSTDLTQVRRLAGVVGNANEFSIYISVAVLMLVYFCVETKRRSTRFILLAFAILLVLPIILSGSRGSILFVFPVVVWQLWKFDKRNIPTIFLFLAGLVLFASFLPVEYISRLKGIPQDILTRSDTVGLRFELWEYAIELWKQDPIFGIGTGAFVYLSNQSPALHGMKNLQAHNMYITHLAENGIVGLGLFALIIIRSVTNFEKAMKLRVDSRSIRNLAVTWESVLLIFLLNGVKGNLNANKIMWFAFAISAVLVAVAGRLTKLSPESSERLSHETP